MLRLTPSTVHEVGHEIGIYDHASVTADHDNNITDRLMFENSGTGKRLIKKEWDLINPTK